MSYRQHTHAWSWHCRREGLLLLTMLQCCCHGHLRKRCSTLQALCIAAGQRTHMGSYNFIHTITMYLVMFQTSGVAAVAEAVVVVMVAVAIELCT